MGESALTSHLKGKKTSNTDIPEKVTSNRSRFFCISSQRPATTSDDAKVVSKSTSSESGEHNKLKGQMNQNFDFSLFLPNLLIKSQINIF